MKLVRDHLFIGNISDANNVIQANHDRITHMLSLLSNQVLSQENRKLGDPYAVVTMQAGIHNPVLHVPFLGPDLVPSRPDEDEESQDSKEPREFVRITVPLRDMDAENLLDCLPACLDFIEQGRQAGKVLVHCLAGVSRSAAVVTAFLMRSEKLTVNEALKSLRKASPSVCPNEGFMDQLKMFQDMGYKVDPEHAIYRQFRTTNLGQDFEKSRKSGKKVESSRFATDPSTTTTSLADSVASQLNLHEESRVANFYRCKKCRRLVASQSNVLAHSPRLAAPVFKSKRRGSYDDDNDYGEPTCSSIFVEPMQWMTTVSEGNVDGKLFCATCQARLGNFDWSGIQCSCGAWVNPAFQLHKCKMDLA